MSALLESPSKPSQTPFHDLTLLPTSSDNLRPTRTVKRPGEQTAGSPKRVDFGARKPLVVSIVTRSKLSMADFARPTLELPPSLQRRTTMSPPKPPKIRRLSSLLTSADLSAADRFIPSHRNSTSGRLKPVQAKPLPSALPQSHIKAHTSKIYQHHVAEACGLDVNSRILSYSVLPPERSKPLDLFSTVGHGSSAVALRKSLRPALASERAKSVPAAPERVLDAPNIVDDFYLNLVAWSLTNLIVIGLEDAVYVWNASSGLVGLLCETAGKLVSSLRWSEDGSYISIGKDDGTVEIWDIETNSRLRTLCTNSISRVAAHCWLLHLLTQGSREGIIYHSDVRVSNHLVGKYERTHGAEICGIEYRADGQQFSSGGNDNLLCIWDARNMNSEPLFKKTSHRSAVKAIAWCPYQSLLLCSGGGTSDKTIHFWNTSTGLRVNLIETESQISSLNWGYAKGTGYEVVATHGFPSNSISLFNYPTLQKTAEIVKAHDLRVLSGCMSPDGTTLATVAGDENLKFWSLFDHYKPGRVEMALFAKDGKQMSKLMNIR